MLQFLDVLDVGANHEGVRPAYYTSDLGGGSLRVLPVIAVGVVGSLRNLADLIERTQA